MPIENLEERFKRTVQLIGMKKFALLQKSRVTVVGVGAVGGYAVEGIVRAGVGSIRLVDFDTIEASNLNRQLIALTTNVGLAKVAEAKKRIKAINPDCKVESCQLFASEENMEEILSPAPDLLIDAIDSLNPKIQLLSSAYHKEIPIISSMGAALRTDPTKIRYGDLFDSHGCPLARHVRKRLRRRNIDTGISCVYSTEKVDFDYSHEDDDESETDSHRGRQRNILGSLPTVTGIFGLYIANQAILTLASR